MFQTSPDFSDDNSSDDDSCSEAELHDAEDDLQTLDHRGADTASTQPDDQLAKLVSLTPFLKFIF